MASSSYNEKGFQIFVKTMTGKTITLDVADGDTIDMQKITDNEIVEESVALPAGSQQSDATTLEMDPTISMQVFVVTLNGDKITMLFTPFHTVGTVLNKVLNHDTVKQQMQEKDITNDLLYLKFGGKALNDHAKTLLDYSIKKEDDIYLTLRTLGGGGKRKRPLEDSDSQPRDADFPIVAQMLVLFATPWNKAKWMEVMADPILTPEKVQEMKQTVKARGGTAEDKALRLLAMMPNFTMLTDRLLAPVHCTL